MSIRVRSEDSDTTRNVKTDYARIAHWLSTRNFVVAPCTELMKLLGSYDVSIDETVNWCRFLRDADGLGVVDWSWDVSKNENSTIVIGKQNESLMMEMNIGFNNTPPPFTPFTQYDDDVFEDSEEDEDEAVEEAEETGGGEEPEEEEDGPPPPTVKELLDNLRSADPEGPLTPTTTHTPLHYQELVFEAVELLTATVGVLLGGTPRSEQTRAMTIRVVDALLSENHLPMSHSSDVIVSETSDMPARPWYYREATPATYTPGVDSTPHADVSAMLRRHVLRACVQALIDFDVSGDEFVGIPQGSLERAKTLLNDVHAFIFSKSGIATSALDTKDRFLQLLELAVEIGFHDPDTTTTLTYEDSEFQQHTRTIVDLSTGVILLPKKPSKPTLLGRSSLLRFECAPNDVAQKLLHTVAAACRVAVCALLQRSLTGALRPEESYPLNTYTAGEG